MSNQYADQRYFKSICNDFVIAFGEAQKLWDEKEENSDFFVWFNRAENKRQECEKMLLDLARENKTIIVNTEEEIFTLMMFYSIYSVNDYRVINEEETHLMDFPNDEKSVKFKKAYFEKDEKSAKMMFLQA